MSEPQENSPMTARQEYLDGQKQAQASIAEIQAQHRKMVLLRTILFIGAAICLILGYYGEQYETALKIAGWIAAFLFFAAIVRHEALRLAQMRHESDFALFALLLARLDRNWSEIPQQALREEHAHLMYADDLDIAGDASLLSLLALTGTEAGSSTLQEWLTSPPSAEALAKRQASVKALVPERQLRLQIIKRIRSTESGVRHVYGLPAWGRSENWLPQHRVAHVLSYVGPCLIFAGLLAWVVFAASENRILVNTAACTVGAGMLLNILLTIVWGSWIHDIFQKVTGEHRAVFEYAGVFASFGRLPDDSGLLRDAAQVATQGPNCAVVGFQKLTKVVKLANFQRDVMLYVVYLVLQLFFVWDFRILKILEQWKNRFGADLESWFDALGVCEAVICGATLADEYPDWAYASLPAGDSLRIEVARMGHPLLPDTVRVVNDMTLTEDRPLLLVTGSNMAGKSTFLRAFGLNLLLARTGTVVCASHFSSPQYELATSIRVRDSLKEGVSFFRAELNRLKEVVDKAHHRSVAKAAGEAGPPILFLLDEILQGTNSKERQIAVASVLERLLGYGALGFISTHDLDLASAQEIEPISQVVHFREYFESDGSKEVMCFDYKMRPGPTPTTNALKLLQIVGLHSEPDETIVEK